MKKKVQESFGEFSLNAESILQTYSTAEAQQWAERWRDVYASAKRAPGLKQYLWHTFSWDAYPSVSGAEAKQLYAQHGWSEVVVLSNDRRTAVRCTELPVGDGRGDFYVFPVDLAWTMAFTHEDGWLGPFFAKHPDYAVMIEKAKQQRQVADRKALELSRAKQKGWM